MIEVHLRKGRTIKIDADKADYADVEGVRMLRITNDGVLVGEFYATEISGWNQTPESPRTTIVVQSNIPRPYAEQQ